MSKNFEREPEMAEIIRAIIDGGWTGDQADFKEKFALEASQRWWTEEEIEEAIESPLFPRVEDALSGISAKQPFESVDFEFPSFFEK